ncbi:protein of unknown function [Chryseobacterium sp. JV274]|nr:protein of unknown function [Chryseobacterium sp. JV274]
MKDIFGKKFVYAIFLLGLFMGLTAIFDLRNYSQFKANAVVFLCSFFTFK